MGTQQRFHVLFGIGRDLLELVDGDDDRFGGTFQVSEYFVERGFCGMDIAQLEIGSWDCLPDRK